MCCPKWVAQWMTESVSHCRYRRVAQCFARWFSQWCPELLLRQPYIRLCRNNLGCGSLKKGMRGGQWVVVFVRIMFDVLRMIHLNSVYICCLHVYVALWLLYWHLMQCLLER
jgi:hypothetical protein